MANTLEIEVGTNGHCGGNSSNGCRTYFRIQDLSSTDIEVSINGGPSVNMMSSGPIEIVLGGDNELDSFIKALEFAARTLKKQSK